MKLFCSQLKFERQLLLLFGDFCKKIKTYPKESIVLNTQTNYFHPSDLENSIGWWNNDQGEIISSSLS